MIAFRSGLPAEGVCAFSWAKAALERRIMNPVTISFIPFLTQ
jgi:hypothetical protein